MTLACRAMLIATLIYVGIARADDAAEQPATTSAPPKETAKLDSEPTPTVTAVAPPAPMEPRTVAKPPPYSLPWQLRPVAAGNALRSDTSVAFYDAKNATTGEQDGGATVSSMLLASYKVTPTLAPLVRMAFVYNEEPALTGAPGAGGVVVNPLLGVTYAPVVAGFKVAAFGAVTLPIGQGGGETPDVNHARAASRGVPARSAMDNAMFAVDYAAIIGGAGAAYIKHGFTAQIEATVLQLFKARGPDMADDRRTNFTAGLHTGYFVAPQLSLGGELRYQRWLTDAAPVKADPTARETVTFAVGPRLHIKLEGKQWLRPGVSYARVLDAPFSRSSYQMVQIDIPFAF